MQLRGRVLANSLTLSRLLLVVVLVYLYSQGNFPTCFLIMLGICLSDILDGFVARKYDCQTTKGAILDAGTDFVVLITLYGFYCIWGSYPSWLIILMVASFGLFGFIALRNKTIVKSRFGKYTGAVLYGAVTLSIGVRAFSPRITAAGDGIAVLLSGLILTVSITENLIHLYCRRYDCVKK